MLAKFRCSVVPEYKYYWIYQDPAADDAKLTNETSKKERKYGNL